MTLAFWTIAATMVLVALALVLRPLVRGGGAADARLAALERARRDGVLSEAEYASKRAALAGEAGTAHAPVPRALASVLALVIAIGAVALYRVVGQPLGLFATPRVAATASVEAPPGEAPALEDATRELAAKMAESPEDFDGWLLLGRSYKQLQQFAEARDALAKANALRPEDPDAMVEYAEALALASEDRRLAGEARALLDRALALEPNHQRGLWLLGIAAIQDERWADAVATWETLLPQLPPESSVAESVREQIAQARARAGMPALAERVGGEPATGDAAPPAPAAAAPAADDAATGPRLVVEVSIAPELAARIAPTDTLFVFARAPEGPKMPLAIQRIPVPSLPATIVLDDSMGMMPALKLSQAGTVVVGARISKSGNATPSSGDLEVISRPLEVASQRTPVKLFIDRVVP